MTHLQTKQQAKNLDNSFPFKRLTVFHHNKNISKYDFSNHPVLLGRSKNNAVVLRSPSISRHHASITTKNKKIWIKNLSRKNDLYVNKQAVQHHSLTDGDVISIGEYQLYFTMESSVVTSSKEDNNTTSTVATLAGSQPQKNQDTNGLNRKISGSSCTKLNDQTNTATVPVLVALVILVSIPAALYYTNNTSNLPISQNRNQSQPLDQETSIESQEATATLIEKKKTDNRASIHRVDTFYGGVLIETYGDDLIETEDVQ